jgi:hypothetical protein
MVVKALAAPPLALNVGEVQAVPDVFQQVSPPAVLAAAF